MPSTQPAGRSRLLLPGGLPIRIAESSYQSEMARRVSSEKLWEASSEADTIRSRKLPLWEV